MTNKLCGSRADGGDGARGKPSLGAHHPGTQSCWPLNYGIKLPCAGWRLGIMRAPHGPLTKSKIMS